MGKVIDLDDIPAEEFWCRDALLEALMNAPAIEPERKKGEWIPMFDGKFRGGAYWFKCSECSRVVPDVRNGGWNFCPECGMKMIGGNTNAHNT